MVELATMAPDQVVPVTAVDPAASCCSRRTRARCSARPSETWPRTQRSTLPAGSLMPAPRCSARLRRTPSDLPTPARCPWVRSTSRDTSSCGLEDFAATAAATLDRCQRRPRARVREHLPRLAQEFERVAALGLPLTLHAQRPAPVQRVRGGRRAAVLRLRRRAPQRSAGRALGAAGRTRPSARVRGATTPGSSAWPTAIEVWTDLASSRSCGRRCPIALRLARLGRCESWIRCFPSMNDEELEEYGDGAPYWLEAVTSLEL